MFLTKGFSASFREAPVPAPGLAADEVPEPNERADH